MSSLVPGYMTVSWTVSPPAVGVRVTCGVEGRPVGGGEGRVTYLFDAFGVGLSRHSYPDK